MLLKIQVYCDVASCLLADTCRSFETSAIIYLLRRPESWINNCIIFSVTNGSEKLYCETLCVCVCVCVRVVTQLNLREILRTGEAPHKMCVKKCCFDEHKQMWHTRGGDSTMSVRRARSVQRAKNEDAHILKPKLYRCQRDDRNIASLILNHGTRWRWVVALTPRPLYPLERAPIPVE